MESSVENAFDGEEIPTFVRNFEENSGQLLEFELPTAVPDSDTEVLEDDGEPEIIYNEDDDDFIADVPDEEEEEGESEEWGEKWEDFRGVCQSKNKDPLSTFAEHIQNINGNLYSELMSLVQRLTPEEIMELTSRVKRGTGVGHTGAPSRDKTSPLVSEPSGGSRVATSSPVSSGTDSRKVAGSEATADATSALIHLTKGLDQNKINEFIVRIDAQLGSQKFENVNVITNDWDSTGEFFPLIPAAKKLFAKYVEAGLIGCLLAHGYQETAKKVYCIAYVKGRKSDGDNLVFRGVDPRDYKEKVKQSVQAYSAVMKSTRVDAKKKAPLEFFR